ncbi:MAG: (methylthio)acryloyl-CoA hydratase [Hyphomicrobiales bacterium]|jgi:enoyl-CoA hydratase/carnithine racemase|nr:(methylthio)acryloyl-CoA hydratase [Hyphomicrobiales bacterium]
MAQGRKLPKSLKVQRRGAVAILTLARPEKRNALNDATVLGLEQFFATLPAGVKAVVLNAEGKHFSAGLDLSELKVLSTEEGIAHSRMWHGIFDKIEFGRVPVVTVMHGAVVGGGLELAAATHVRIAERSAYYALPEGSRGIFVGGGGSVRLPRIIGTSRMMDLMLTGRTYGAEEGQAFGISHYLVGEGEGLATGIEIAKRIASNSPTTNFAILNVLPRIAEQDRASGYVMESLTAAIAQGNAEAKKRIKDFLEKRAAKVERK